MPRHLSQVQKAKTIAKLQEGLPLNNVAIDLHKC